jgi:HSP20 family molecular chaperone IbpA
MKPITVRIVHSISEDMEAIQNRIRVCAYEKSLNRVDGSNGELQDWLAAERELISIPLASITEDDNRLIAEIEIPDIKPKDLEIHVTTQDVLIHAEVQTESANNPAPGSKSAFGVIRFPTAIDPAGVRAEYSRGILRLTAPISEKARSLTKGA